MEKPKAQKLNAESRDLGTHAAGAVHLHETRETANTVIEEPAVPNPTRYDTRTGNYKQ